jgi:hypothetical protein
MTWQVNPERLPLTIQLFSDGLDRILSREPDGCGQDVAEEVCEFDYRILMLAIGTVNWCGYCGKVKQFICLSLKLLILYSDRSMTLYCLPQSEYFIWILERYKGGSLF